MLLSGTPIPFTAGVSLSSLSMAVNNYNKNNFVPFLVQSINIQYNTIQQSDNTQNSTLVLCISI